MQCRNSQQFDWELKEPRRFGMLGMGSHPFTARLSGCDVKQQLSKFIASPFISKIMKKNGEGISLTHQPYKRTCTENIQISASPLCPTKYELMYCPHKY